MATELHVTTPQNYANTQDKLEGLRAKLRELEAAHAIARRQAGLAESNRATRLAATGGIDTDPNYVKEAKAAGETVKAMDARVEEIRKQHAEIKAEVDRLEGNPTLASVPVTEEEANAKRAVEVINAVTEEGDMKFAARAAAEVEEVKPGLTPLDDPNLSQGSIQAAISVAQGKNIEREVRQIVEIAQDREAKVEQVQKHTDRAIEKALKAPRADEYATDQRNAAVEANTEIAEKYAAPAELEPTELPVAQQMRTSLDDANIAQQKAATSVAEAGDPIKVGAKDGAAVKTSQFDPLNNTIADVAPEELTPAKSVKSKKEVK